MTNWLPLAGDSLTADWEYGEDFAANGGALTLSKYIDACETGNQLTLKPDLAELCKRGTRLRVRVTVSCGFDFAVRLCYDKMWHAKPNHFERVWDRKGWRRVQAGQYVDFVIDTRPITDCDYVRPCVWFANDSGSASAELTVHATVVESVQDSVQTLWQPVISGNPHIGWEFGQDFEATADGLVNSTESDTPTTDNMLTLEDYSDLRAGDSVRIRVTLDTGTSGGAGVRFQWQRFTEAGVPLYAAWSEGWYLTDGGRVTFESDTMLLTAGKTIPTIYVAPNDNSTVTVTDITVERKTTANRAFWQRVDNEDLAADWEWGSDFALEEDRFVTTTACDVPEEPASIRYVHDYECYPGEALRVRVATTASVDFALRMAWEDIRSGTVVWEPSWVQVSAGDEVTTLPYRVMTSQCRPVVYVANPDGGSVAVTDVALYERTLTLSGVADTPGVEFVAPEATNLPHVMIPGAASAWVFGSGWATSDGEKVLSGTHGAGNATSRIYPRIEAAEQYNEGDVVQVEVTFTTDTPLRIRFKGARYTIAGGYQSMVPSWDEEIEVPAGTHTVASEPRTVPVIENMVYVRPWVYFEGESVTVTYHSARMVRFLPEVPRYESRSPVQLRATAYEPLGPRIGPLPDVIDMTITQPRNDASTLSMTYAAEGVRSELFDREIEIGIEYSYDGIVWDEAPGCRFLTQKAEGNPLDDGTTAIKFSGISISGLLDEVLLWEVPEESQDSDGKWNFLSRNAGTILRTIWDACVARGWGDGLTLNVTPSTDSAGAEWATITTLAFDRTVTLQSVLNSLTDIGMIDWLFQGRTLHVFNADTACAVDRSDTVRWPLADGSTSAPESRSWADLCTDVLVKGEGGNAWTFHNETSPSKRRIEKIVSAGGVELESTARQVAETTLQTGATIAEEVKREWVAGAMRWAPFVDYRVGDWIGVQRGDGVDKLQVVQLSLTMNSDGVTGHTTFGTVLDDLLSRLAKKQKGIVGAASISGNTLRPADTASKRTPATPSGLVGRTTPYTIATGAERATLDLTWAAVAADDRGNAMDNIEYEILLQVAGTERIWPMGDGTTGTIEGLYVGDTYQVYVRAKSTEYGTLSHWSEGITITPEGDSGIPPVPATPTCTANLAVLNIKWNGLSADDGGMPDDFDHIEASVTVPEALPVVVARTYNPDDRQLNVPGLSAGTYWVRLRAWDTTGHVSDWSDYAEVTVTSLVDSSTVREELELMLPEITEASAIYQRAAALVAGGDVKWGPYPPDDGVPGTTFWIAPDGKLWIMKSKAEGV